MVKKIIGIILALIIMFSGVFMEVPQGLTRGGLLAIAVLVFAIVLWITDVVPIGVTSLFVLILIPLLGILPPTQSWGAFGSSSLFFIVATASVTTILLKTKIPTRAINALNTWSKGNPKKFIFGFMGITAIFSILPISNVAIAITMMGFALVMIKAMDIKPGESNLAKCLLIACPAGAMIGSMVTPISTTVNVVAIDVLARTAAINIGFFQWVAVGLPTAIILFFCMYFSLILVLKPEAIPQIAIDKISEETSEVSKFSAYEIKVIVILAAMFVLWTLSGFFPVLNTTYVAIAGLAVMFLPKIELLTFREYARDVPWNVILVVGAVNVISAALISTGAAKFVAGGFVASTAGLPVILLALSIVIFFVIFNGICPMGPGSVGLLGVPVIAIAVAGGVLSPVFVILALAISAGSTFLLPISPPYLVVYDQGHFSFANVFATGLLPTLGVLIACLLVVFPMMNMLI